MIRILLVAMLTGCSFVAVSSKPRLETRYSSGCGSVIEPSLDLVGGLVLLGLGVVQVPTPEKPASASAATLLGASVVSLASALYGYSQRRFCREAAEGELRAHADKLLAQPREKRCAELVRIVQARSEPELLLLADPTECVAEHDDRWQRCIDAEHAAMFAVPLAQRIRRWSSCGRPMLRTRAARAADLIADLATSVSLAAGNCFEIGEGVRDIQDLDPALAIKAVERDPLIARCVNGDGLREYLEGCRIRYAARVDEVQRIRDRRERDKALHAIRRCTPGLL